MFMLKSHYNGIRVVANAMYRRRLQSNSLKTVYVIVFSILMIGTVIMGLLTAAWFASLTMRSLPSYAHAALAIPTIQASIATSLVCLGGVLLWQDRNQS